MLRLRALLLFFCCICAGLAQTTGRLTGNVVDPQGSPVPGAEVRLYLPGGEEPVAQTLSTSDGLFHLSSIPAQRYDLQVEAAGFQLETVRGVKIDAAREATVPAVQLQLGAVTFSVEVVADLESLQASTSDVSVTVDSEQIRRLPLLDRNPLRLVSTQAGVGNNRAGASVINGQRASFTNITLDGANIQDNYVRSNGVDFLPNALVLDQVAEFTVTTSNGDASLGGGASQLNFVTPSGGNNFHGSAYWSHRNNALAANDWFANADGLERPSFAQNQVGFTLSGPISKDRLLFFQSFEFFRLPRRRQQFRVIPTETARNGIFSYVDANGELQRFDPRSLGLNFDDLLDPTMQSLLDRVPGPEAINNYRLGDSREGQLLNTAGYSYFASSNLDRINSTSRIDYLLSSAHSFSISLNLSRANNQRADLLSNYEEEPPISEKRTPKVVSGNWRWNPTPQFTNELRGGFNLSPVHFDSKPVSDRFVINPQSLIYSSPINTFVPEGRDTNYWFLQDNGGYVSGTHHVQFGYQMAGIRARSFDEYGIRPSVTLRGVSVSDFLPDLTPEQDLMASFLYAAHFGTVSNVAQTFNVTSRTSGFIPYQPRIRHYRHANYAWYLQDDWRIFPRFTLNLGVRHEFLTPVNERDGLALLPVGSETDPLGTLLSNATLDFAGSAVGRPFHQLDSNNLAPHVGFAWDLSGSGTTVLRGAYSIHYVNDETLRTASFITEASEGLTVERVARVAPGGAAFVSDLPDAPVDTPPFQVPLTLAENYLNNSLQTVGTIDPNLRTPLVHEWSFGIQRRLSAGMIFEGRYVGNRGLRMLRTLDFNAPILRENGFLDDFLRARQNGQLALAARGTFDPSYNPAIAGSSKLTVFPQLDGGGFLDDGTVRSLLQTGEAAGLALFYQGLGLNGPVQFQPNPLALGAYYLTNASSSTYHSVQLDLRRRLKNGLQLQANYTFSKVLSDAVGTAADRFDPYLDPHNGGVEKARAPFDLSHAIKANFIWELPFHREGGGAASQWLGGWSLSGVLTWQSGSPFSIVSGRETVNDVVSAKWNTVDTALTKEQIDALLGVRATAAGPSFLDPEAINPDGQADKSVFANPQPGQLGSLQRRQFSGPWTFNLDFAVLKTVKLTEQASLEFRGEAANLLNNSSWVVGDQNINSAQFGRITAVAYDSRRVQLGLYLRF